MDRKISICTLCASSAQDAADYLKQRASEYFPDVAVNDFEDASAFAAGVDSCTSEGGVILAAAPVSEFLKAKIRLIKTVSTKIVRSNSISAAIGENDQLEQKEREFHTAIPEKSKTIRTADGLYSAFVKEHGNSVIVFLPLDSDRLDYLFGAGLAKMLGGIFTDVKFQQKPGASEKKGIKALREHVEAVIKSGKKVAISPCGCAKPLVSAISTVPEYETAFIQNDALRDKLPDESMEDYIAQCAKLSKENTGTDLGISVSSIYKDKTDDSDFVIVCVADSDRAKVAKVYANPGEDKKHLVAAAVIRLCEMLDELSGPEGLVNPEIIPAAPKKWSKNSKLPIIITAVGIALAVIIGVVLAFVFGGEKTAESDVAGSGFFDFFKKDDSEAEAEGDDLDMQAGAIQTEQATYFFEFPSMGATTQPVSMSQTVTQIMTTLGNVAISSTTERQKLESTAAKVTTTAKGITTLAPTTVKATTTKVTATVQPSTTLKPTTTAAPTTTAVPTTTAAPTTTRKSVIDSLKPNKPVTTVPSTTSVSKEESTTATDQKGVFVFKSYGWGHGVGMSQYGAIQMAKDGITYDKILTHYFTGTTVKTDPSTPTTIKYGGKDIPIVEYLCKSTFREISDLSPLESLKAQAVAIYTFAKFYDFDVPSSKHAYGSDFKYEGTDVHKAVLAVLGMSSDSDTPKAKYIDYNGEAIFSCFFASAGGKTTSCASVWGGNGYPYLVGGVVSPEKVDVTEEIITIEQMKKYINAYASDNNIKITLSDDPAEWLEIISHDSSMNEHTGYVKKIRVGDKEVRGNNFRCYVLDFKIDSHCFTFQYIPE